MAVNNPTQGTLLARASVEDLVWDSQKRVYVLSYVGGPGTGMLFLGSYSNTASVMAYGPQSETQAISQNWLTTPKTAAYSYATDNFQLAAGGALTTLDTSGSVPVVNQLTVGSWPGLIQRTELYPRAMTSSELAAITTPGVLV